MAVLPRLFIVDPMCVLNYGHNPQSLIYYSNYFAARGFECIPVACRYFKSKSEVYKGFIRHFGYYYEDFVKLPPDVDVNMDVDEYVEELALAASDVGEASLTNDVVLNQAILDWHNFIETQHLDAGDFIFYPSVDFYGAIGLLHNLRRLPVKSRPTVHLRFIGVMENARIGGGDIVKIFRSYLNNLGDCVSVSAEAPIYSSYLTSRLRVNVATTVYPPFGKILPRVRKAGEPFVVISAGAGREDKGFLRLRNIIEQFSKRYPEDNVRFKIQNLRATDELRHISYVTQLYAAHNVTLTPAIQTDAEITQNYAESDLALLPYDFETYKFRGSAVFMESLLFGRPFVISRKTGFEPFVPLYTTAASVTSDVDFANHIHVMANKDPEELADECARARLVYIEFSNNTLEAVFDR